MRLPDNSYYKTTRFAHTKKEYDGYISYLRGHLDVVSINPTNLELLLMNMEQN